MLLVCRNWGRAVVQESVADAFEVDDVGVVDDDRVIITEAMVRSPKTSLQRAKGRLLVMFTDACS